MKKEMTNERKAELKRIYPMPHLTIYAIEKKLGWTVMKSTSLEGSYEISTKDSDYHLRLTEKELGELNLGGVVLKMLDQTRHASFAEGYNEGERDYNTEGT